MSTTISNRRHASAAAMPTGEGKRHPGKAILAGGITGAIEICISYPTEYVKTQLHLQKNVSLTGHGTPFSGPIDVVTRTVKQHGPGGLYRGIAPLILFSIPKVGVRFFAYESVRNVLVDKNNVLSPGRTMLAGLIAGSAEAIVAVAPMETIKVKFIHDRSLPNPQYKSLFQGLGKIISTEGFRGIYQGLTATIVKQASNQAIRFSVYNPLRKYFQNRSPDGTVGVLTTALCGAVAGAASVFGNTPVDVVKTRMQGLGAREIYRNSWHCAQLTWQEGGSVWGGVKKFYQGCTPRLARVMLDVALTFSLYEQVMRAMDAVWRI